MSNHFQERIAQLEKENKSLEDKLLNKVLGLSKEKDCPYPVGCGALLMRNDQVIELQEACRVKNVKLRGRIPIEVIETYLDELRGNNIELFDNSPMANALLDTIRSDLVPLQEKFNA